MASVERKQEKQGPFYLGYDTHRPTSAEIVTEARRSLRTLQTRRPFTPREEHRQLFTGSHDGRPPSTFSLHARNFDVPDSRPNSGTRLSPLRHKPGLPRPPPDERTDRRGSGGARKRLVRARSLTLELCTSQHSTAPQSVGVHEPTVSMKYDTKFSRPGHNQERTEKPLKITTQIPTEHSRTSRSSSADFSRAKGTPPDACHGRGDAAGDDGIDDESLFWTNDVLPVVQTFESVAPGGTVAPETIECLREACRDLYNVLLEKGMLGKRLKRRSYVLRALFRLIDLGSDPLNLALAQLILALEVSGNNLLNICKLVFKISRSSRNDFLFQDDPVIDSLLSLIDDCNSGGEAVLYCMGSLKLLSGNSSLARLLLDKDFITVSLRLSERLVQFSDPTTCPTDHHTHTVAGHILVQVTSALRNMADFPESRPSFLSNDVFSRLCAVMDRHQEDQDVCLNVSRIFSKLSSYAECCIVLAETPSCYRLFLSLLCKHSRKQALAVRLLFTLGNLAARSNHARERVYEEENTTGVLLELFQSYLQVPENHPHEEEEEEEDVLIKLIRVLANMSIHPGVGSALAANTQCVELLMKVIELRSVDESPETVVNALTAINNLSYVQGERSVIRLRHAHVSRLLLKLLLNSRMDAVLEAIRVFGNLSQIEEVQSFIIRNKVHQFVVALLDSKNPDMCFSACGVLTNLAVDPKNRVIINQEGAIHKLIDCLRDFGPQDWLLATQVCQTLWNCTEDTEQEHSQELLEILSLYSDQKALKWPSSADIKAYQEACWELKFLPVAERLMKRTRRHTTVPGCHQ